MIRYFLNLYDVWAKGRHFLWWVPFFVLMVFLTYQILFGYEHSSIFSPINLGIHEGGHLLFCFSNETFCAFGGTLLQTLAPLFSVIILWRGCEFFGVPFCMLWLSSNLFEIAVYMADARSMELPLVTVGGGEAGHDWNTVFGNLHILPYDTVIANVVSSTAFLFAAASLVLCAYLILRMKNNT
jgi:hypothetical protein